MPQSTAKLIDFCKVKENGDETSITNNFVIIPY